MFEIATWVLAAVSGLGTVGVIGALIFVPLKAVPILENTIAAVLKCKTCLVVAALVAVGLGSFWYGREGQYDKGHAAAIAEIASENAETIANTLAKRNVWKECRARNGMWIQETGECK